MMRSSPEVRFSRRARAVSWAMEMPPVSSMNSGASWMSKAASRTWPNSEASISPRRMRSEGTPEVSDRRRMASCSDDISSWKNATTPPLTVLRVPSGWGSQA